MPKKGKAGRELMQVGRDFIQNQIIHTQILLISNSFLVFLAISIVGIAVDILYLKNLSLSSRLVGYHSLDAIILVPLALFIIGFIPILGGIGFFGSLITVIYSLQQISFLPGSFGLLTGVMSGISFRKDFLSGRPSMITGIDFNIAGLKRLKQMNRFTITVALVGLIAGIASSLLAVKQLNVTPKPQPTSIEQPQPERFP